VADSTLAVPIRIMMPENGVKYIDNVVFDASNPLVATSMTHQQADAAMEMIKQSTDYSSSDPYYSFSVSSIADKNFVQIAPYLLFDVYNVEPINQKLAAIFSPGRGGGAVLREFNGTMIPVEGIQVAPMWDAMEGDYNRSIDFITLAPGEVEEFFLTLTFLPDYYYDFRIGLQIKFNGQNSIVWTERSFLRGYPSQKMPLYNYSGNAFALEYHPDADRDVTTEKYVRQLYEIYRQNIAEYNRSRVFRLEMAEVDGPVMP